ncbi:MAG: Rieske 2Fe-2S domain-containing protein [Deltaproteobacteria bacterium]|nr:Rieske 2Fe-2S domain-containing protein [Deltaproteobacteria bacterium]
MFSARGALEHLLRPADYTAAAARARDLAWLRGHWHLHALACDLQRDGDQVADEVAGVPVVVRNDGGRLVGFVNVCPHRHSLLVGPGATHAATLRCMVHGWTFDDAGALCRLPDGPSFVGLDGSAVRLRRVAVERCGALVFVNLNVDAPPFVDGVPDGGAELRARFGAHRPVDRWTTSHAVDWKVIVENAVESYHVPLVHPATFRAFRPPELHDHRLWPGGTRYADRKPWGREPMGLAARLLGALFGAGAVSRFVHTHYFPTTMTYANELVSTAFAVMPRADGTSRVTVASFLPDALSSSLLRPLQWAFGRVFSQLGRRIVAEDMRLWPHVQRGLQSSEHAGVLGAREERVHAFQHFVVQGRGHVDDDDAVDAVAPPVACPAPPLRLGRRG